MELPSGLARLLTAIRDGGGRPYLVGGAVRDALRGGALKDYDVEVFGLEPDVLKGVLLRAAPSVNLVGESFTVYKVHGLEGIEGDVDVSLPRRDSKQGHGHRGIRAEGDPHLSVEEATRRRDFTINAMLLDPRDGAILDPFGGRADLEARRLRAVDASTFGEDPLRALRAVQLAARFELEVDPATAELCARMPLAELPAERILGEIQKLLLQARRPSIGFALMRAWGMLPVIAPPLVPLPDTPQDPEWHPEGDVWTHTLLALDQAVGLLDGLDAARALTVMLGVLCHDLGKPATTKMIDGRWRSYEHEPQGIPPTLELLDRWNVHTLGGFDVRAQVVALVANHLKPGQLYEDRERVSDGAIRRLAARCDADLLCRVATADCTGRKGDFPPLAMEWFRARVTELDALHRPPAPLLMGRHLLEMGLAPGPRIGAILRAVYELQLDGALTTLDAARDRAREMIGYPSTP